MKSLFQELPDNSEFMQGDLITNYADSSEEKKFGMILNADCDIAQRKFGNNFSWIEIIPAIDYLNSIWSEEQCHSVLESKRVVQAISAINQYLQKKNKNFLPLTVMGLCEWLGEYQDSSEFFTAIGKTASGDEKTSLELIRLASNTNCNEMTSSDRLRKIWKLLGKKPTEINESLKKALTKNDGFPDFFLLPELENYEGKGFVALLRVINSTPKSNLFKSSVEARINSSESYYFYRFSRLSDGIRFHIVQKMAFLFSRIGAHPHFEDKCTISAELVSKIYVGEVEK